MKPRSVKILTPQNYSESSFESAFKYIDDISRGAIPAGELIHLAVARHIKDLEHAGERGFRFDTDRVDRVYRFFSYLCHWKGKWAGTQFVLAPWQAFAHLVLFGWVRTSDDTRRFRDAYIEVPRKNGKSTWASGTGLYMAAADMEAGAEVYSAATTRSQARIIFDSAKQMVLRSPELKKRFNVFTSNLSIDRTASKFEPVSSEASTLDGLSTHCALVDELHEHKTPDVLRVLDTSTGARTQSLIFKITTAGWNRESVCWREHEYAERILRAEPGFEDDAYFAFIATIDKGDDWRDESSWIKANPNYGISVNPEDLRRKFHKAEMLATEQNNVRRKHLDEWTEQDDRWLEMGLYDASAKTVTPAKLQGRQCFAGLDLSTKIDLTAFVLVFPPTADDECWYVLPRFWFPRDNMPERIKRDRVPFDVWARNGHITATDGNVVDYREVRKTITELAEQFVVTSIGYDPWNATETALKLQDDGFEMVETRQGARTFNEPMTKYLELLLSGKIVSGTNPVMRWCASNLAVRRDANDNIAPDKKRSTERIDGMVAMFMGMARALSGENVPKPSVYETRGVRFV